MDAEDTTLITALPFVEVELVYDTAEAGASDDAWCALQLQTKNRIYDVDWGMRCFAIRDRVTGAANASSHLLGALLTGGQKRGDEGLELTFPVPRPGVSAVFEVGEPPRLDYVTTSEIERVVLRLRVLSLGGEDAKSDEARKTWSRITHTLRGHTSPRGSR